FRALNRIGGVHHVRTSSRPVYRDGVFDGFTVVMSDITEEIKAKEELARERHLFTTLMDTVPDHIYFKDRESRFIRVNRSLARYFGLDHPDRAAGKIDADFFSDEHARKALEDEKRILKTGKPLLEMEEKETWPDGRVTWVSTTKMPLYDGAGRIEGTFGISRDITERRRAETQIKLQKERLENIIEGTNAGTWEWNVQTGETRFNEHWAKMIGYTLDELSPVSIKTWKRFIHPDDLKASEDALEKHFRGETDFYSMEFRMKHKNGGWVWVLDRGKVITRTPDGRPLWMYGTHQDITQQKAAEDAVRAERKKLSDIINTMPNPVFFKNEEGRYEECNRAFEEYLGIPREKILGATVYDIAPSELAETYHRMDLDLMASKERQVYESKVKYADGSLHDVVFYKSPLLREDGTVRGLVGMMLDITDRKRAEEAILKAKEEWKCTFDAVPDLICLLDPEYRIVRMNRAFSDRLGKEPGELIGIPCYECVHGADGAPDFCPHTLTIHDHRPHTLEVNIERMGGTFIVSTTPMFDPSGGFIGSVLTAHDITERKRAEEALVKSESRYRHLFTHAPAGIYEVDFTTGRFVSINSIMCEYTGYTEEELLTMSPLDILTPESRNYFLARLEKFAAGEAISNDPEYQIVRKDGSTLWVQLNADYVNKDGRITGARSVAHNISERKKAEELLVKRLAYERALSNCSRELLASETGIDAVTPSLGHLLAVTGMGRVYMFENFDDPEYGLCMRQTHEVCAPGVSSELDNPELQRVPYREGFERWREKLEGGMPVMGIVKDFPPAEREMLEPQGIIALLVIPVSAGGRWHGFIGFDDTEREREWDANDIFILNTAAEMIGDFIDRSRAYEAVRESERQMRLILNSQDVGVVIIEEASHKILFINRKALALFGAPEEEVLGKVCHNYLCNTQRGQCPITDLGQDLDNAERTLSTVDGREIPILKSVVRVLFQGKNCLVESFVDITDRKQAEDKIKGLLIEKELLLREVHHRIKNNMTTISSLLSIQSRTLSDERAVSALSDARGRIQSMMVIYDKLYRSTDFREVSAAGYFDELIEGIASTFPAARRVTIMKNIEDQTLDSKTLFP
ncbi:MAG TPA: PAS domain S-box protein, partial [Spirochaetes bacterium]|nr:PAS domain S-box protein [Spirochaetota bacterium]